MTHILNFKAFRQKYHASFNKKENADVNYAQEPKRAENNVSWSPNLQIPAYIRRNRWTAKHALELRGINFSNTNSSILKDNERLSKGTYRDDERESTQPMQERIILTGRMIDICNILEKMEHSAL